jgi:hypothetical protein
VIVVSGAARKMIEEALKLPEDERAEIAGELLVSLDGSGAALGPSRKPSKTGSRGDWPKQTAAA